MASILIVDPAKQMHDSLGTVLEPFGHHVSFATNAKTALTLYKDNNPDIVITDFLLGRTDGLTLVKKLKKQDPSVTTILMNSMPDKENAIQALKAGVFDYLKKPIRVTEFMDAVNRAIESKMTVESTEPTVDNKFFSSSFCFPLIGDSKEVKAIRKQLEEMSMRRSPNLLYLQGEKWTGKRIIAESIHQNGSSNNGEFVEAECDTMEPLDAVEFLIGQDGMGGTLIKKAYQGTLFVKNVEALPLEIQSQLGNVISIVEHEVHLICSSEQSIDALMVQGSFSDQLYYRIALDIVNVPPLRDRREDIPQLVSYLLKNLPVNEGAPQPEEYSPEEMDELVNRDWPGNLLELIDEVTERANAGS